MYLKFFKQVIFNAGRGVDKRRFPPKLLKALAENYNPKIYAAKISANHEWGGTSYGQITKLTFGEHPDAKENPELDEGVILADFELDTTQWLGELRNKAWSVEFSEEFAIGNKVMPYLYAISAVDNPASLGIKRIKLSEDKKSNREILASGELVKLDWQQIEQNQLEQQPSKSEKMPGTGLIPDAGIPQPTETAAMPSPDVLAGMQKSLEATQKELTKLSASNQALSEQQKQLQQQNQSLDAEKKNLEQKVFTANEAEKNSLEASNTQLNFPTQDEVINKLQARWKTILLSQSVECTVKPAEQVRITDLFKARENILSKINYTFVSARTGRSINMQMTNTAFSRGHKTGAAVSVGDGLTEHTYKIAVHKHSWCLPFSSFDSFSNTTNMLEHYDDLMAKNQSDDLARICPQGTEQANQTKALLSMDKGFDKLLAEWSTAWDGGTLVLDEIVPTTGVIIVGKRRVRKIVGLTPTDATVSGTIKFTLPNHGFVKGGKVRIEGDSNHAKSTYKILPATTTSEVHLKDSDKTVFAEGAVLVQEPDFPDLDALVGIMKDGINHACEMEMFNQDYRVWFGYLTLREREGVINQAVNMQPTEYKHLNIPAATIGLVKAETVHFFKTDSLWLVEPKNLSRYELKGSRRSVEKTDLEINDGYVRTDYAEMCTHIEDPRRMFVVNNLRYLKEYNEPKA